MKLGLISDTHDRLPTFRRALELFRRLEVDAVFHAGDLVAPFAARLLTPAAGVLPKAVAADHVHVIYGNNDGERAGLKKVLPQIADGPRHTSLSVAGFPGREPGVCRVAVAHYFDWFSEEDLASADLLISGHDHQAKIQTQTHAGREVLWVNPGECCGWVTGRCTVAVATIDADGARAELIEVHG